MSAKSTIGVAGASVTLIGSVIGITIFILPGVLAASAGPAVIAAYALAGILAVFSCVVAAQVGTVFSVSGAGFVAVGTVLGPAWGFLLVWMILGGVSLSIALLAYGAADYLATVWPHLNHGLVAAGIILSVYALNLSGIRGSVAGQSVFVGIFLIVLTVVCIGGIIHGRVELLFPFAPNGLRPVLAAVVPAFYSYTGFMVIIEIGGEIRNPSRTVPLSLLISFLVVISTYMLASFSVVSVIPWRELASIAAPVSEAAARSLPRSIAQCVTWAATAAATGTINALLLGYSRDVVALARVRLLPSVLAMTLPRRGPVFAVTALTVLSLAATCAGASVAQYATTVVLIVLLAQIVVASTMLLIPRREADLYSRSAFKLNPFARRFFGFGLIVLSAMLFVVALVNEPKAALITAGYLAAGVLYYGWRRLVLRSKNIDLDRTVADNLHVTLSK